MAVSARISWNRHPRRTVQVTGSPFKVIPAARSGPYRDGTRAVYSARDTVPSALRALGTTQAPTWPSSCTALAGFARSVRYSACAAACMARAASSLRSGTGHASRYVVGDVKRPRCNDALPILRRFAPSLPSPRNGDGQCERSSPAQPWSVMLTVLPRFIQTPRWHACCEEEQQARQRPLRCR